MLTRKFSKFKHLLFLLVVLIAFLTFYYLTDFKCIFGNDLDLLGYITRENEPSNVEVIDVDIEYDFYLDDVSSGIDKNDEIIYENDGHLISSSLNLRGDDYWGFVKQEDFTLESLEFPMGIWFSSYGKVENGKAEFILPFELPDLDDDFFYLEEKIDNDEMTTYPLQHFHAAEFIYENIKVFTEGEECEISSPSDAGSQFVNGTPALSYGLQLFEETGEFYEEIYLTDTNCVTVKIDKLYKYTYDLSFFQNIAISQ